MNQSKLAQAYPELIVAAEGPVLDTSCAALMRLAGEVHDQGYKVALTGEGADEALAGYVWFKTAESRRKAVKAIGPWLPKTLFGLVLRGVGGGVSRRFPVNGVRGTRPAQQDLYELLAQVRPVLFTDRMWQGIGEQLPFDDLDLTADRFTRWAPLNQSLYVGYKLMLAGLLMLSKGDRIAMHNSVEARYPFLDDDVIRFCASVAPEYKLRGKTEKWLLRQVAARTLPPRIANRPKTMFRATRGGTFLGPHRPAWVDQLLSRESLEKTGYFRPDAIDHEVYWHRALPMMTPRSFIYDMGLTSVVATQLWHHLFLGGGLCELPNWTAPEFAGNRLPTEYKTRNDVPEPTTSIAGVA